MELLERDRARAALDDALEASLQGVGRLVSIAGEGGIGKTALVRSFVAAARDRARVLVAGCDDLLTPRPLGPLHDLARSFGDGVGALLASPDSGPAELFPAVVAELAGRLRPAVLVVEDLHWADGATLDWLAHLARRLDQAAALLVLTHRTDERDTATDVGRVLAAAPRDRLVRISLEPLSRDAALRLVPDPARTDEVMQLTRGNPLFLTELARASRTGATELPPTVRDHVLGRVAALSASARDVVEVVASVPGHCPWSVLEVLTPTWVRDTEQAMAAGVLEDRADGLAFRHEIARQAVEAAMSGARRRVVNTRLLEALATGGGTDPARLAHHARQAGRAADVLVHAAAAGRAAAAAGAHRQALEQYRAALPHAAALPDDEHVELLVAFATEARICNRLDDAITARQEALAILRRAGDDRRSGACLAELARLHALAGHRAEAESLVRDAIAVLESVGAGPTLSGAYGHLADLLAMAGRFEEAEAWGARALAMAEELDDAAVMATTLSDTGSGVIFVDPPRGEQLLHRAFELADGRGHVELAGRASSVLALGCLYDRRYELAGERLERALAYAAAHELHAHAALLLGLRSRWHLDLGRWDDAEQDAREMLGAGDQPGVSLCPALVTLGLLHARRGEDEADAVLDDAWERALHTGDLQRIAPTAAARAEHAWLRGDPGAVARAARPAWELALEMGEPWALGELGWWLCAAGERPDEMPDVAEPFRLLCEGDWAAAAAAWEARGLPYERALALARAPDPGPVLEALSIVDGLGASATGTVLRRRLRELGLRTIPRGPRAATRAHPAGLTSRQQDVLALVAEGLTNAQIADQLVVSVRTVDHHVSAILGKLGVTSRDEAAARYAATDTAPA